MADNFCLFFQGISLSLSVLDFTGKHDNYTSDCSYSVEKVSFSLFYVVLEIKFKKKWKINIQSEFRIRVFTEVCGLEVDPNVFIID